MQNVQVWEKPKQPIRRLFRLGFDDIQVHRMSG